MKPKGGKIVASGIVPTSPIEPAIVHHGHLPPPAAMAMQISQLEQDHHAELRRRSYLLAVERGHIRR